MIVHALDEKARAYYNLEGLWTPGTLQKDPIEEVNLRLTYTCPRKSDLVLIYIIVEATNLHLN